ncbi:MAG TPA: Crp/Fnr family transcriptional regulator [Gammaproteobacteria bacterium]|nr:Crp/Fnr family transcriptional regulator [Gammaproteobacteria bacterium]
MLRRNLLQENAVLAAMSARDSELIRAMLEPVTLHAGDTLYEPRRPLRDIYFPVSASIALLLAAEEDSAGIAMVGNDGMLGTGLMLGVEIAASRAVVVSAGDAYRIAGNRLKAVVEESPELRMLFLRCAHLLTLQAALTAVCNRRHLVKQQLCRWLSWMIDHTPSWDLYVTHSAIAVSLGVRREAITEALGKLQDAGAVACSRGRISVLEPQLLHQGACSCYSLLKAEHERLLGMDAGEDQCEPPESRPRSSVSRLALTNASTSASAWARSSP